MPRHFHDQLKLAIEQSTTKDLPYAKALLEHCGSGMSSEVLETMEWLADHHYMVPSDACLKVLDKAFTACDYRHNSVYPATLSHADSDQMIDGWVRYHAGRPYGMPVYLAPETAARLSDGDIADHQAMEITTAHGTRHLIPVGAMGWDIITIELPDHPADPVSSPEREDIPF